MTETGLCRMHQSMSMTGTGNTVSGDVLGYKVAEIAGADRSVRGASIDHWQGASAGGRFGERAAYDALHSSTFF